MGIMINKGFGNEPTYSGRCPGLGADWAYSPSLINVPIKKTGEKPKISFSPVFTLCIVIL